MFIILNIAKILKSFFNAKLSRTFFSNFNYYFFSSSNAFFAYFLSLSISLL